MALKLTENPVFHNRSKHIDIRFHQRGRENLIKLEYLDTSNMTADVLTKGLPGPKFREMTSRMDLSRNLLVEGECKRLRFADAVKWCRLCCVRVYHLGDMTFSSMYFSMLMRMAAKKSLDFSLFAVLYFLGINIKTTLCYTSTYYSLGLFIYPNIYLYSSTYI